jgi:hypothetical protein
VARGIAFSYERNSEMLIHADEMLPQRLTMNLLDDAIKCTLARGRELSVPSVRAGAGKIRSPGAIASRAAPQSGRVEVFASSVSNLAPGARPL